jgi:hypothetical protein
LNKTPFEGNTNSTKEQPTMPEVKDAPATAENVETLPPLHAPAPETVDVAKNREIQDQLLKEQQALLAEQEKQLRAEQAKYDAKAKAGTTHATSDGHEAHHKHSKTEDEDLEEHTVPELKDIAAQRGITIPWDANKAEIIKAIKKHKS